MDRSWIALLVVSSLLAACGSNSPDAPLASHWELWLESAGGPLPFGLELDLTGTDARAWLVNGSERIGIPRVELTDATLVLGIDHYDSVLELRFHDHRRRLVGEWTKRRGPDRWARMKVGGLPRGELRSNGEAAPFVGRWQVDFASSDDPAVGVFEAAEDGALSGTFLTTTGDYRFLAGRVEAGAMTLSCFDGAHAFLFRARLDGESLRGDFWSSDSWHERWTAVRDEQARLPDAFAQTTWTGAVALADVRLPDVDGRMHTLADPEYAGRARILHVFGSWCPNCHDASEYLVELHRRYAARGLSIVGLAFELTEDFARDAEQVRRYVKRHDVPYPVLIAGPADKAAATEKLGLLDFVRSYPTTVFLHEDGRVRAIHSGFSGPATGAVHRELRVAFERIIEELLAR